MNVLFYMNSIMNVFWYLLAWFDLLIKHLHDQYIAPELNYFIEKKNMYKFCSEKSITCISP